MLRFGKEDVESLKHRLFFISGSAISGSAILEIVMEKKLQVFMSSTYTDMVDERQAAVEAVLDAGHIPAGMELFAAGDETQLETIRRWIDDSDVFMLILGGRYGSIETTSGKSYIQLEYEYALKKKKRLFAAIISDQYLDNKVKAAGLTAAETDNVAKLRTFREAVKCRTCRFFDNVTELQLIIHKSLSILEKDESLTGWVRGSDVLDPKVTTIGLTELQKQNRALRRELDYMQAFIKSRQVPIPSEGAFKLLLSAKNSDGHILYVRFLGGAALQAGNLDFIVEQDNRREEAYWKAALNELVKMGLIEDVGSKGETFSVTKLGYEVTDAIEKGNA